MLRIRLARPLVPHGHEAAVYDRTLRTITRTFVLRLLAASGKGAVRRAAQIVVLCLRVGTGVFIGQVCKRHKADRCAKRIDLIYALHPGRRIGIGGVGRGGQRSVR